jgi:hypothetical protein
MSFNIGFNKEFEIILITDRRLIAKNYLKTWFFIDLLSTIPY